MLRIIFALSQLLKGAPFSFSPLTRLLLGSIYGHTGQSMYPNQSKACCLLDKYNSWCSRANRGWDGDGCRYILVPIPTPARTERSNHAHHIDHGDFLFLKKISRADRPQLLNNSEPKPFKHRHPPQSPLLDPFLDVDLAFAQLLAERVRVRPLVVELDSIPVVRFPGVLRQEPLVWM